MRGIFLRNANGMTPSVDQLAGLIHETTAEVREQVTEMTWRKQKSRPPRVWKNEWQPACGVLSVAIAAGIALHRFVRVELVAGLIAGTVLAVQERPSGQRSYAPRSWGRQTGAGRLRGFLRAAIPISARLEFAVGSSARRAQALLRSRRGRFRAVSFFNRVGAISLNKKLALARVSRRPPRQRTLGGGGRGRTPLPAWKTAVLTSSLSKSEGMEVLSTFLD
jgi:hypothetical protein